MSHKVFLGVGSNIRPRTHLLAGLDELDRRFVVERVSGIYRSDAVGFDGDPFLNCAVQISTDTGLATLARTLRQIEFHYGRTALCGKFSSRSLDIDILTFDRCHGIHEGIVLPREETTRNAFVLGPLAEIAGDEILPGQTQNLSQLWAAHDPTIQPLTPVPLRWRERSLPWIGSPARTRHILTID